MSGHAAVRQTTYRAGLAFMPGEVQAVVFDLPGCQCTATYEGAVRELLPVVIAEHIAWLDQHGDVTRDAFPFEVLISERVEVDRLADVADGESLFEDDLRPVQREEVETSIRQMGYARSDLLAIARYLPHLVLDWEPPAHSVIQDDSAAGVRTVRRILGHIAGSDGYYAGNIGHAPWDGPQPGDTPDVFEQRQRAIARLRSLTEPELAARWERRHSWQTQGAEHWTVRKALRRFISHERFHTREIEQRLAWLLLGTPVLDRNRVAAR
jgi:DinB family protein